MKLQLATLAALALLGSALFAQAPAIDESRIVDLTYTFDESIPENTIVLVHTGWGRYWPDKKRYLGSDKPGETADLHFPGISEEAARLLVNRGVDGVGIDTASLDHGQSRDFLTHRVLTGANIYGLENVAHLERLPARGATLIALPLKIKGGTGGPVRIIAILPE